MYGEWVRLISNLSNVALFCPFVELLYLQPNKRKSIYCVEEVGIGMFVSKKGEDLHNLLLFCNMYTMFTVYPECPPPPLANPFIVPCALFLFPLNVRTIQMQMTNIVYCAARPMPCVSSSHRILSFQFLRIMIMKTDSWIVPSILCFTLLVYLSQVWNVKARLMVRKYLFPLLICKAGTYF